MFTFLSSNESATFRPRGPLKCMFAFYVLSIFVTWELKVILTKLVAGYERWLTRLQWRPQPGWRCCSDLPASSRATPKPGWGVSKIPFGNKMVSTKKHISQTQLDWCMHEVIFFHLSMLHRLSICTVILQARVPRDTCTRLRAFWHCSFWSESGTSSCVWKTFWT